MCVLRFLWNASPVLGEIHHHHFSITTGNVRCSSFRGEKKKRGRKISDASKPSSGGANNRLARLETTTTTAAKGNYSTRLIRSPAERYRKARNGSAAQPITSRPANRRTVTKRKINTRSKRRRARSDVLTKDEKNKEAERLLGRAREEGSCTQMQPVLEDDRASRQKGEESWKTRRKRRSANRTGTRKA